MLPQFFFSQSSTFFNFLFFGFLWLYWWSSWRGDRKRDEREGEGHAAKVPEFNNVNILASEDGWFETLKLEQPCSDKGGGLRHYLSSTYNPEPSSLPRRLNNHSHLGSASPSKRRPVWESCYAVSRWSLYKWVLSICGRCRVIPLSWHWTGVCSRHNTHMSSEA